jgi:hypothetical protein
VADGTGLLLALSAFSASPHEVTLVASTLDDLLVDETPQRVIADKAYDSDHWINTCSMNVTLN